MNYCNKEIQQIEGWPSSRTLFAGPLVPGLKPGVIEVGPLQGPGDILKKFSRIIFSSGKQAKGYNLKFSGLLGFQGFLKLRQFQYKKRSLKGSHIYSPTR
jgi:hypothetical protein